MDDKKVTEARVKETLSFSLEKMRQGMRRSLSWADLNLRNCTAECCLSSEKVFRDFCKEKEIKAVRLFVGKADTYPRKLFVPLWLFIVDMQLNII